MTDLSLSVDGSLASAAHRLRPERSFTMLTALFGDPEMARIFSESSTVQAWLDTERALALAQAEVGVLTEEEGTAIADAAVLRNIDLDKLWDEARNVGYPILPLVRMIAAALPDGPNGRVHYGATTQDIMDTGLVLQLRQALDRLEGLAVTVGDGLAGLIRIHRHTVMAARTHAQQAVPTTLGAKLAVFLGELTRHRERVIELRHRVQVLSLYGAGGTAAALGGQVAEVREAMARILELGVARVPWHVARDPLTEFASVAAMMAATCGRFAMEVIELSRTELGEVRERDGHHRGASSTMPQKANPVDSEAVVGMAACATALVPVMFRAMGATHERSAGEWQMEWQALPQVAELAAGCLATTAGIAAGLRVFPDRMRSNLELDGGLIMAEAYMVRLAPILGRERAHDVVYAASRLAREQGRSLASVMARQLRELSREGDGTAAAITPDDYLGEAEAICDAALQGWAPALELWER